MALPFVMGFLEETSSAPPNDRWIYPPLGAVRTRRSARRRLCRRDFLWTSLRCWVKTNLGRSCRSCRFVLFFYGFCSWQMRTTSLDVLKKWRRKHRKKTNSLISWWAMLDGLKRKKLSFVALQTFRMHSENFKRNPVSTSPMSCATPIPRKTEM